MKYLRNSRIALLALTAGGCIPFISQAAAADQSPATDQASVTNQDAGSETADIVVTATRRNENLQNVPVAVTAITAETLASQGVTNIQQLTNSVPSFVGGKNSGLFLPTMRGVGSFGTGPAEEANVALYVDGVYQPDPSSNLLELGEVTQVEVLRGPQGTLFGRNATGGLINIKTPDPSFEPTGALTVNGRTIHGGKDALGGRIQGFAAGPLSESFAFSVSGMLRKDGGYFKDVSTGKARGENSDVMIRPKLLFKPNDDASIQLMLYYRNTHNDAAVSFRPYDGLTLGSSQAGAIPPIGHWDVSLNDPVSFQVKRYEAALTGEFAMGPLTLNTVSDYQESRQGQNTDNDASNISLQGVRLKLFSRSFSQEIRITSPGDEKFRWMVGGFGMLLHGTGTAEIYASNPNLIASSLIANANTAAIAAFGSANYDITSSTTVDGSIRYSAEERDSWPTINGVRGNPIRQKISFNATTYQVSLRQRIGSTIHTYLTYSTGFKSGVFNSFSPAPPVRPEHNKMLEFGFKGKLTPGVRLNVAVFDQKYDDIQVSARLPGSQVTRLLNAASAKQKGVEAELDADVTDAFHVSAQASFLDAKYKDFDNAVVYVPNANGNGGLSPVTIDAAGKRMVRAPKFSGGINASYEWPVSDAAKIVLDGNVYHSSRIFYDFANRFAQKSYTTANLGIAWVTDNWRIRGYVTNITNEAIYQQISPSSVATYVGTQEPRIIGIEVRRTW